MTGERENNPYNLKIHEEKPNGYLTDDELISLFASKNILVKRTDNLPRFAHNNSIDMIKIKREGSGGLSPTVYKIPSTEKLEKIKQSMKNTNNSILGKKTLKEKKEEILKIFDNARDPGPFNKKLDALPINGESDFDNTVKKKRAAIVKERNEICESRTSIARKVAKSLGCACNRKYVKKILEKYRSSQIDKRLLKPE